jgi:hypothetical protein
MLPSPSYLSSDLQNIPISISLLHEEEYKNLCVMFKKDKLGKRRACSEKNIQKNTIPKHLSVSCK